jgi:hypothetical protein
MGIALRQADPAFGIVDSYYAVAKREITRRGDLEVTRTDVFKSNFLDLVRTLAAKQQSHVVIVAHGTEAGFYMNVTETSTDSADNAVLSDLVTLVDSYPSVDAAKITAFASGYTTTEDDVKELVQVCHKVRNHDTNCVAIHIRGCKLGKKVENLDTIRKLFGSIVVSAPKCPMLYAPCTPEWSRPANKDVEAWKRTNSPDTRRREFSGDGRSRLVLDVNYAGTTSSTQGVIEHANDLPKWASVIYGNSTHGTQFSMPIAAMWPDDGYFLPHESGYLDQINASRVT